MPPTTIPTAALATTSLCHSHRTLRAHLNQPAPWHQNPPPIADSPMYPTTDQIDALSPPPFEPLSELQLRDIARQIVSGVARVHSAGWSFGGLQIPQSIRLSHICSSDPAAAVSLPSSGAVGVSSAALQQQQQQLAGLSVFSLAELEGLLGQSSINRLQCSLQEHLSSRSSDTSNCGWLLAEKGLEEADAGFRLPRLNQEVSWPALLSSPRRFNQLSQRFTNLGGMRRPPVWSGTYMGEFRVQHPPQSTASGKRRLSPSGLQILLHAEALTGLSRVARPFALPLVLLAELCEARNGAPCEPQQDQRVNEGGSTQLEELQQRDLLALCRVLCQLFFPVSSSDRSDLSSASCALHPACVCAGYQQELQPTFQRIDMSVCRPAFCCIFRKLTHSIPVCGAPPLPPPSFSIPGIPCGTPRGCWRASPGPRSSHPGSRIS